MRFTLHRTLWTRVKGILIPGAVLLVLIGLPCRVCAYSVSNEHKFTTVGEDYTFLFTNLPPAVGDVDVTVTLYGDYGSADEYAAISIEFVDHGVHQGADADCVLAGDAQTYTIGATNVDDEVLYVLISNSTAVGLLCHESWMRVRVDYTNRDLVLDNWSFTNTVTGANSEVTCTYEIRNSGTDPAGSFDIRFYYGENTSTSNLVPLATNSFAGLDGDSGTGVMTNIFTMPADVMYGTGYIHYVLDYDDQVVEHDETNNRGLGPIEITGRPDLQFTALSVFPTNQIPGGELALSYRIVNGGASAVPSSCLTRFYYSTNSAVGTSDEYLGSEVTIPALNAGEYWPGTSNGQVVVAVPPGAPFGTGYIGAIVDWDGSIVEESTANNSTSSAIDVLSPSPDLTIASFSTSSGAQGGGFNIGCTFEVSNVGNTNSGAFYVSFYYGDTSNTTSLIYLDRYSIADLPAGDTTGVFAHDVVLPVSARYGTRYLHYFVDYLDAVAEIYESNNRGYGSFLVQGLPDLTVSTTSLTPSNQVPGGEITLSYRFHNAGFSAPEEGVPARFYFSVDSNITTSDVYMGQEVLIDTVDPDGYFPVTTNGSVILAVPDDVAPGVVYFGAYVDPGETIDEVSDDNNSMHAGLAIPELRIESISSAGGGEGRVINIIVSGTGAPVTYEFQYRTDMTTGDWLPASPDGDSVQGNHTITEWSDHGGPGRDLDAAEQLFYRVIKDDE